MSTGMKGLFKSHIKGLERMYRDLKAENMELVEMLQRVLTRIDLEPVGDVFPCSAMREDIRKAIQKAEGLSG